MANPSSVRTMVSIRSRASSDRRPWVTSTQADAAVPRPTRPRSWWSCDRPKRSACSTTISVAFGTSTPTSITVVETSTSSSRAMEGAHDRFLLRGLHPPVQQADPRPRAARPAHSSAMEVAARTSSSFSDSSTSG